MQESEGQPIRFTTGRSVGKPVSEEKKAYLKWYHYKAQLGEPIDTYQVHLEIARVLKMNSPLGKLKGVYPTLSNCKKHSRKPIDKIPLPYLKWYYYSMPEREDIREEIAQMLLIKYEPFDLSELMGADDENVKF